MHRLQRAFRLYFHRFFLLLFLGSLISIFVVFSGFDRLSTRVPAETYRPADMQEIESGGPAKLKIGIFVDSLYNIDRSLGTFSAKCLLWGTWDDADEKRWKLHGHDHEINSGLDDDSISFQSTDVFLRNAISVNKVAEYAESPVALGEGSIRQFTKFSSEFKMDDVDYRNFPFEEFYLPIVVATPYPTQNLVLIPDERDSLVSDNVDLPGYRFNGLNPRNIFYQAKTFWGWHQYAWGDQLDSGSNPDAYSEVHWELHFRRAIGPSFVRLFLPLAAAMVAILFSLIISFKVATQKIGIPSSILLVLAVLQDRWHSTLPPGLKYFTYMDELFMFAYLITMIVLAQSIYCINRCHYASEDIRSEVEIQMRHHQRILASGVSAALLITPFVLWFI